MNRILILPALLILSTTAVARPSPDRLGICYLFQGEKLTGRGPCIVSPGYGAGAQYVNLLLNGKDYAVEYPNIRPNMPPTLNGKVAIEYQRDTSFLNILKGAPMQGEEYMTCVKTKDGKTDICYFLGG